MPKYPYELINEAHDLAFYRDADRTSPWRAYKTVYHTGRANRSSKHYKGMTNKQIAEKLKLTDSQLHYILYKTRDSADGYWVEDVKKEPTITESFLNFFISEDCK